MKGGIRILVIALCVVAFFIFSYHEYRVREDTRIIRLAGRRYLLGREIAKARKCMIRHLQRHGIRDFHVMYDGKSWTIGIFDSKVNSLDWARDIPISRLLISCTQISDLSPIESSAPKLKVLKASHTLIQDIGPLRDCISLDWLNLEDTPVRDLSPLANTDISYLAIRGTQVTDVSPIRTNKIARIWFSLTPQQLRGIEKFKYVVNTGAYVDIRKNWRVYDNYYSGTATNESDMEEYHLWEMSNREGPVPYNFYEQIY